MYEVGYPIPQTSIIKGDANNLSIAICLNHWPKVTRDKMMVDYDKGIPGYGFAKNAGYGTSEHLEGLNKLGITPIHRKTFEPIKSMVAGGTSLDSLSGYFSGYRFVCSHLFLGNVGHFISLFALNIPVWALAWIISTGILGKNLLLAGYSSGYGALFSLVKWSILS